MNWRYLRWAPWVDTRAQFVAATPRDERLIDLGSSDGETLRHIAELRPDLRLSAVDMSGEPEHYPAGCEFRRLNLEHDPLPWPEASMAAVTCMHLVEHLTNWAAVVDEAARVLQPGGRLYIETPHPRTLELTSVADQGVSFTRSYLINPI